MKKAAAILLIISLIFLLTGCGGPTSGESRVEEQTTGAQTEGTTEATEGTTLPDIDGTTVPDAASGPTATTTTAAGTTPATTPAFMQGREFTLNGETRIFEFEGEYTDSYVYIDEYGYKLNYKKKDLTKPYVITSNKEAVDNFCKAHPRKKLTEAQVRAKADAFVAQWNDMKYFTFDESEYEFDKLGLGFVRIQYRQQYNGNRTMNAIYLRMNLYGDINGYIAPEMNPELYDQFKEIYSNVDFEVTDRLVVETLVKKTGQKADEIHIERRGLGYKDGKATVVYIYPDSCSDQGVSYIDINIPTK